MMEGTLLLALPEGMLIDQIQPTETGLAITMISTNPESCCPLCSQASSSVHSHYQRTLRDVPCAEQQIRLSLTVQRFYCHNALCERKVFTERMPQFVQPWAWMTIRFGQALQSIGLATNGQGGTRLATRLGMQTSRNTILHRIMELPNLSLPSVVYLGVDDFSFRRGYRFGTILVE